MQQFQAANKAGSFHLQKSAVAAYSISIKITEPLRPYRMQNVVEQAFSKQEDCHCQNNGSMY